MFLGIDPGMSGGLARIGPSFLHPSEHAYHIRTMPMPNTESDVWSWVSEADADSQSEHWPVIALVEKVGGYTANGPQPGSAMFKFGRNVGVLVGCLIAAGIPFEEVTPQKWQKEFGLSRKKGESKTSWKNRGKSVAQKLFPGSGVTLSTCDALLIAEYARRKYG